MKNHGGPTAPALNSSHVQLRSSLRAHSLQKKRLQHEWPFSLVLCFTSSAYIINHKYLHTLTPLPTHKNKTKQKLCVNSTKTNRSLLLLKPVWHLLTGQQCLGQAYDLWTLTVKLTLPPLGCCAKCQERPLILSCCLVDCSPAHYFSRPDWRCHIPNSAQIRCGQTGPPTYSARVLSSNSNKGRVVAE